MNAIDHSIVAPLIRGLCMSASKLPRAVIPGAGVSPAPAGCFEIDLTAALKSGALDEEAAAKALTEACDEWKFERAPSGAEASGKAATVILPSCVLVRAGGEEALYWSGADLDEARARRDANDASPWYVAKPAADARSLGSSAIARSSVVANRIALVTGGAQGFGEEIVRGLAASGASVFIADLNLAGAEKLAAELNAERGKTVAIALASNVADEASVEAMFRLIAETAGGLDLCVSNAGVLKAAGVLEQDLAAFKFVTDVNYTGFFIVSKHCGRLMRRQNRTAPQWKTDIVQINSKSGLEGSNKNGAYAGGKFGSIGLVASFALELVEYGIKVNAICPGNFFDGPLWSDPEKGLFIQYLKTGKVPGAKTVADVKAFYEAKVPMKRGCEGADVMRALYYIVEQEYETGQAVPVTGGQVMLH
ncbi:MAG TPA: short-chain dehydrogenase [Treponema sp.]|nr:MAG: short-chain dehydrogenase [Treponema sp. GWA1_62_8]HCM25426.1 short-chain dehydrogenase [Treponema sp.]